MIRRVAVVASIAMLTACSVGPDYQAPKTSSPEAWAEDPSAAAAWPSADWWNAFGSHELDQLVTTAIADNHDLAAAVNRVVESEAQAKIAGAPLYPSLDAAGGVTRSQQANLRSSSSGFGNGSGNVSNRPQTLYNASLSAAYEIDLWGKNRSASDAATTRVRSSQFDQETVEITLMSDVATTYFQILSLRDRVKLAQDSLKNAQNVLDLLEQQRRIGTISDLEVAQQKNAVAAEQAIIPGFVQQERQAIHALALLLGKNPEELSIATQSLDDAKLPPVIAGIPSVLLERRPDLRKAEADLIAANYDIKNARAQRFPSIDLTASGGTESLVLSGLMGPESFLYSLAASVTAPIFEGGKLEGQEQFADARFKELMENYRQAILGAFRDVEDALAAWRGSSGQYDFDREAFAQAQEAYRLADLRFRAGTVDFLTVLQAQNAVFQAEDALVVANVGRFNALVGLYKALGGGWSGTPPAAPPLGAS